MRRLLIAVLCVWATLPPSALAQPATRDESIRAMHLYGYCVVQQSLRRSRRILSVAPGSTEERELLRAVADDRCLSGHGYISQISYDPQLLRGAIAEWLLDADFAQGGRQGHEDRTGIFTGLSVADITALGPQGQAALRAIDLALCVAVAAPDGVETLLETQPTSEAEERAFRQLMPHLSPCLAQGQRFGLSRPQLRGVLAEAAYRQAWAAARREAVDRRNSQQETDE